MPYTPSARFNAVELEDFKAEVLREFEKVAQSLAETDSLELRPIYAAPSKPREGMIVHADGTRWNPGGGGGAYQYKGGAWVKL